jgi:hypothetical protein
LFFLNKDVSFELSMKDVGDIVCILLDVTEKYKSCFGVKFLEKIGAEKGKRIMSLNDGIFYCLFTVFA